jgi:hypothetical protein
VIDSMPEKVTSLGAPKGGQVVLRRLGQPSPDAGAGPALTRKRKDGSMKNKPKEPEDLSRPSIEVKIPQVKLQLKDLAFLRSLAQPNGVHCNVGSNVKDRLQFLDLIARAKVPPDVAKVTLAEAEKIPIIARLKTEIECQNWEKANQSVYQLQSIQRRLEPIERDILTVRGEALLRTGEVVVRARKVGCA